MRRTIPPASCKGVITVGATGVDGARSYYSNFGPTVAMSAPGGNASSGSDADDRWIWSLGNSGMQVPDPSPAGDRLIGMIGTSMASPHVAGIVALMQSAAVGAGRAPLTPTQVKQVLQMTATPFTVVPPFNQSQGPGIANAAAAVLAATLPIPADSGTVIANRIATATSGAAGDAQVVQDRRARGQDEREPAHLRRHRQRIVVRGARSRADDGKFRSQLGQAWQQ